MLKWILSLLGSFAKVFSNPSVRIALNILAPIALNAVKAIAADQNVLKSTDKRIIVANKINEELKITNPTANITDSLINLAIEIAVQEMKQVV